MIDLSRRERLLAACSHAAILLPGFGFAIPAFLWIQNRLKSAYIREQSMQAWVFQMIQPVLIQLILLLEGLLFLLVYLVANASGVRNTIIVFMLLAAAILIFAVLFIYLMLVVMAAINCYSGKIWRYPWIGARINQYTATSVNYPNENEERLAASLCHAGMFYPHSGLLVPGLILIFLRGQLSVWFKFQAAQSLAIQAGWFVFSNLVIIAETVLAVPLMITFVNSTDSVLNLAHPEYLVYALSGSLGISLGLIFLLGPLLTLFATVAIIRILKGREYNYPLLGKLIRKRIYSGVD